MKLPRYPKYKDSGVKWLGAVPEHWDVSLLKRGFHVTLGKMLQTEPSSSLDELHPYLRAANVQAGIVDTSDIKLMWFAPKECKQLSLSPGDLLVSEGGDVGRSAIWKGEIDNCYFQNSVNRVRVLNRNSTSYLYYWMSAIKNKGFIDAICNRSTIAHFTAEKVAAVPVPFPPSAEQASIASFLDWAIGKIDILVKEQQRLIELLKEKRQAVISHAVTKGISPDASMKSSGIDWIGDIPTHWEVERTKWLFRERDERSKTGEEEMLTVSHLTGVTPRSEKNVNMFKAETNEGYKLCHAGDLVINTLWAWMGAMGIAPIFGMVSPAYNVYVPGKRILSAYVDSLVRMPLFAKEVIRYSKGVWTSRLRLYPEGFFQTYMPVPPIEEQKAIAEHIASENARIESLMLAANNAIELLQERRTALISAAVTGQIDVRNYRSQEAPAVCQ